MKPEAARQVNGLFTALITPFDDQGRVDLKALAKLVEFQVSKGVDGIFPCGSTGLGPMLGMDERKSIAETVTRSAEGKVTVVMQVGCADTPSTVELARHSEKVGATAVASLTPYYYKPGDKAIIKHFETISASVTIPVFAYNIPPFTGNNILPSTASLLARSGAIAGIKDSSRDFLQLLDLIEAVPEEFVVMNGTEEYGLFAIMSGADGLVSGGASALPELFKTLVDLERKGDHQTALQIQKKVQRVKDLVGRAPIPAYYEILRKRGIDCGVPRPPFLIPGSEATSEIFKGLEALGLI